MLLGQGNHASCGSVAMLLAQGNVLHEGPMSEGQEIALRCLPLVIVSKHHSLPECARLLKGGHEIPASLIDLRVDFIGVRMEVQNLLWTTLAPYDEDSKSKFTIKVFLPTGQLSNQLKNLGYQFLSSWMKAHGFAARGNDLREFIRHVEEILCSDNEILISKYPSYMEHVKTLLNCLVIRDASLYNEIKLYHELYLWLSVVSGKHDPSYAWPKTSADNWNDNNTMLIPIFLRHVSGEIVLIVNVNHSSEYLMHLYASKTKTKPEFQYLVYNNKILERGRTLLFYNIRRDATIYVCSRLLGGVPTTLAQYVEDHKSKFTIKVSLPTGQISLQLTNLGCQFLSSWINCLTTEFVKGLSWNGKFTMDDFKCFEGHIRKIKKPRACGYGAKERDLQTFICYVEEILCSKEENLASKYPPYLEHFKTFVIHLDIKDARLSDKTKLYLDTAPCSMTSFARERLTIELSRKYDGSDKHERAAWHTAINRSPCSDEWYDAAMGIPFFKEILKNGDHAKSKIGAFNFMRNIVMHGAESRNENKEKVQYDDGIELTIPAFFKDFLPEIINNLIINNVDISAELEAAIQCACSICDSSN